MYVETMHKSSGMRINNLVRRIGISKGKYFDWKERLNTDNCHNCNLPKRNWLLPWERESIIAFAKKHYADNDYFLREGYRRLTYHMLDEDVAAVSPSTVYRILKSEGLLNRWNTTKRSGKGGGFKQPSGPHHHWHIDIKYVNCCGSFVFLISIIDGYSRYIVHHEVSMKMAGYDVALVIQRAKDKFPDARPRIISDNGGQFISKDFHELMKFLELTHVRTSVAYPQSNGKIERFHRSIGIECLRTNSFLSIEDAREIIAKYIEYYNHVRLHSALNYLTPEDYLNHRDKEKISVRENKLELAAKNRALYWEKNAA
jgi:transposase InsO family protein